MGDVEWEGRVMKKLPTLVRVLRPSLLMDHLRARGLLVAEEYRRLRSMTTEEERSRVLLHDYLPTKARGSYSRFCEVLQEVDGQQHVLTEVLEQGGLAVEARRPKRRMSPQHSPKAGVRAALRSAKATKLDLANKRATFIFKAKHKPMVKPRENALKKMCRTLFDIQPKDVKFVYGGSGNSEDEHPCDCDEVKLINLVLYGVSTDKVSDMREHLIDCVTAFLKKEKVVVVRKHIEFLDAVESSAFVVMRMHFEVYFSLLCILGEPGKNQQFGCALQTVFTGLTKAALRIGGLPAVILFDEEPGQMVPTATEEWGLLSGQQKALESETPLETAISSTKTAAESRLGQTDRHVREVGTLPPIARDIPISQLPEEVQLALTRSCDNSVARKQDCQTYLLSRFPDYFEPDTNRARHGQSQQGFLGDLIQFLGRTVSGTMEDLYTVLHDLRCSSACSLLQKYLTGHWNSDRQQQSNIQVDCVEKPSHKIAQRLDELTTISEGFDNLQGQLGESGSQYLCITGPTASGKTELARQYITSLSKQWIANGRTDGTNRCVAAILKAGSLEDLEFSLRLFSQRLGCHLVVETVARINNRPRRIGKLLENIGHILSNSDEWVIVLDGLSQSTMEATSHHWPLPGSNSWGRGKILITTTEKGLVPGHKTEEMAEIEISPRMKDSEAVDLFVSVSGQGNRSFAERVTSLLDNNVLAVASAAMYARQFTDIAPQQYLSYLGDEILKTNGDTLSSLPRSLQASIKLTLSAMAESNNSVRSVLELLSVTGPHVLPDVVIKTFAQQWRSERVLTTLRRLLQRRTVTGDIENYHLFLQSLIASGHKGSDAFINAIALHSVTRDILSRMALTDVTWRDKLWLTAVQSLVECCDVKDLLSGENKRSQMRLLLLPHMLHLLSSSSDSTSNVSETVADAWLICAAGIENLGAPFRTGRWATVDNKFEQQRDCIENALKIYTNLTGVSSLKVTECHLLLSEVYEELCKPAIATEHAQMAVKTIKAARWTSPTARLARALKLLGRVNLDMGESDDAIRYLKESRELYRRSYGRDSIQEASVMTLMARAYHDAGRNDRSQSLLETANTICNATKTKDDFSLWTRSQTLASLGRSCLEPDFTEATKAIDFLERSLDIRLRLYGYEHSLSALTMTALGRAYLVNQQHLIARVKLQRALEIQDIVLHPDHPDKGMTMQVLGNVERRRENWSEAIRLLKQSLSMRQRVFGRYHHDTAFVKTDLAVALLSVSRKEEALELLQDALEVKRRRFGEHHIEMAIAYGCLGDAYRAMGDDGMAEQCKKSHIDIMKLLRSRSSNSSSV